MISEIPPVWRDLYEEINGRDPNTRDPGSPCEAWEQVASPDGSGDCMTDGHYMCVECKNISLVALRRKRDQCVDCGAKLTFKSHSSYGECPNECDIDIHVLAQRMRNQQAS
jgi:hypothetical protein